MTTSRCNTPENVQEAVAEALRSSMIRLHPVDLPTLEELKILKGDNLGHYLLPNNGANQKARREVYSKEVLDSIVSDEKSEGQIDGFAIGVKTGLERGLGWKGATCNLLAYSMTVGIFNLPRSAAVLGIVPFIFLLIVFQYMTWFTGMAYFRLQQKYPGVYSVPDAAHLIYGEAGRTIMSALQLLFSIMLSGNHIILGSYAFRSLGWKSCAVLLNFVFSVLSFLFTLPRSYRLFAHLAFVSALSVICCMILVMVSSSRIAPPIIHPSDHSTKRWQVFGSSIKDDQNFFAVVMAIANLFFAFGARPCFLPLMAEMRYPRDFPKALLSLISIQTTLYLVMTCVVMHYLGESVASPILASLSPSMESICYMLALPAIIISGCSSGQVSGKQVYVAALRRLPFLKKKTSWTWFAWIFINIITWTSAWILAELVPFFGSFMAIESSLIWVIYLGLGCFFALFLKMERLWTRWRRRWQTVQALSIVLFCFFLSIAGLWSAFRSIVHSYRKGAIDFPFSCELSTG